MICKRRDKINRHIERSEMSGTHYGHDVPYKCGTKGSSKLSEDYGCSYWALINKCPDDETKTYWECLKL